MILVRRNATYTLLHPVLPPFSELMHSSDKSYQHTCKPYTSHCCSCTNPLIQYAIPSELISIALFEKDDYGCTALHHAAFSNHIESVYFILNFLSNHPFYSMCASKKSYTDSSTLINGVTSATATATVNSDCMSNIQSNYEMIGMKDFMGRISRDLTTSDVIFSLLTPPTSTAVRESMTAAADTPTPTATVSAAARTRTSSSCGVVVVGDKYMNDVYVYPHHSNDGYESPYESDIDQPPYAANNNYNHYYNYSTNDNDNNNGNSNSHCEYEYMRTSNNCKSPRLIPLTTPLTQSQSSTPSSTQAVTTIQQSNDVIHQNILSHKVSVPAVPVVSKAQWRGEAMSGGEQTIIVFDLSATTESSIKPSAKTVHKSVSECMNTTVQVNTTEAVHHSKSTS